MSKYNQLWSTFQDCMEKSLILSFAEIEQRAGSKMDHSFLTYQKELREYGYEVFKISMKNQTVEFRKISEASKDEGDENMNSVYEVCPVLENSDYLLRLIQKEDAEDLWKVYSDKKAIPFFNSDNCHGDTFAYETLTRMQEAVDFWIDAYTKKWFVRFSIMDKKTKKLIGTIELFHRDSTDAFHNTGLLRLDLLSDYEKKEAIISILSIIIKEAYGLFDCEQIATKAIKQAKERIEALTALGFLKSSRKLIGDDQTEYGDYFCCHR